MPTRSQTPPRPIWQVGNFDLEIDPSEGAQEYTQNDALYESFEYTVDNAQSIELSPNMPGLIGNKPISEIDPNMPYYTDTTKVLDIRFTLDQAVRNALIKYSRYGSESEWMYLSDIARPIWQVGTATQIAGSAEGAHDLHEIPLGDLDAGEYVWVIEYSGGGTDNSHYIDALSLVGIECETLLAQECLGN